MKHIGRKLFHLLGGLGLLSLYFLFSRDRAFMIYGALSAGVLIFEVIRLNVPAWNRYLYTHWGSVIRANEEKKLTGTLPYVLGVALSLYFYPTPVAAAAVCFLAFGDVAATTIGERFGRTKIGAKSLEGTAAFFVASLAAGFLLPFAGLKLAFWVVIVGALSAACIELLPLSLNDNLVIPVLAGAIMEFASRWAR
jgi:dolichol kinase